MRHLTAPRKICSSFETVSARCPRPRSSPDSESGQTKRVPLGNHSFRRLTLHSATGTAQRASPYLGPANPDYYFAAS